MLSHSAIPTEIILPKDMSEKNWTEATPFFLLSHWQISNHYEQLLKYEMT